MTFKITFNDEELCVKEVILKKVVMESVSVWKDGDDDDDGDDYDDEDEHVDTVERIGS